MVVHGQVTSTYPVRIPPQYCPSRLEEAMARYVQDTGRGVVVATTGANRVKEAFALTLEANPVVH